MTGTVFAGVVRADEEHHPFREGPDAVYQDICDVFPVVFGFGEYESNRSKSSSAKGFSKSLNSRSLCGDGLAVGMSSPHQKSSYDSGIRCSNETSVDKDTGTNRLRDLGAGDGHGE